MTIQEYIDSVARRYASGITTEHSFRGDLASLIESIVPEVMATNEPRRIECGAPDYVLTRKNIPIGYVEAKDIAHDLTGKTFKDQYDRYREALNNLAFTDYLEFRFFENGSPSGPPLSIAEIQSGRIVPLTHNFEAFASRVRQFCARSTVTIKGSQRLAEMMADKAKILAYTIREALTGDEVSDENTELRQQMSAFKEILIHDIDAKQFADVYAQTIVYGMFAARLHDPSLDTFSRQEAAELIPKTNPFLRKLFHHIAGYDLDKRIDWIVDDLADLFRATDVRAVLKNYGKTRASQDPIMHFYETFLAEYDPKLRKARGVYYTPEPVVDFIVRAVDDILKTEFGLAAGLADTSKVKVKIDQQGKKVEREFHKVQILDPATGTGTFLAQVVKEIYKKFKGQEGAWPTYVENDLIPRLNGFELLMASYAMAHLKLDLLLEELAELQRPAREQGHTQEEPLPTKDGSENIASAGIENRRSSRGAGTASIEDRSRITSSSNYVESSLAYARASATSSGIAKRFQIYLTNALEEHHPDTGTLWASWLSTEANEANHIKRDTPVMVVIGNPPYSGESSNKGEWMLSLMDDYKHEPDSDVRLKERNSKWINDDYVKFLRYGQYFVEKNGYGVLAFVNNHSFLDNPTFRGMRWNLLKAFDAIYVLDLHGNSTKKEASPDGTTDENVFDIKQGVSINIFLRTPHYVGGKTARVFHRDVFGSRTRKYETLLTLTKDDKDFHELQPVAPLYFFTPKNLSGSAIYGDGFSLNDVFPVNGTGIVTKRDSLCIGETAPFCVNAARDIIDLAKPDFYRKYNLPEDVRDWRYEWARKDIQDHGVSETLVKPVNYRPFDSKYTYYTGRSRGFMGWPVVKVMRNLHAGENVALTVGRQGQVVGSMPWSLVFITRQMVDFNFFYRGGEVVYPAYIYPGSAQPTLDEQPNRVPNLDPEIVGKIASGLGMEFVAEKGGNPSGSEGVPTPSSATSNTLPTGPTPLADAAAGAPAGRVSASGADTFAPIDLLDYIYAVLHSPEYRERYKEFLKIDFPRVPYPTDKEKFWRLVELGGELRGLHLLESPRVNEFVTGFPQSGTDRVEKPEWKPQVVPMNAEPSRDARPPVGDVFINPVQYFSNVPRVAWEFYIGGYQPAQKWLKDRKGRKLSYEDIQHYQRIIVALVETDRVMKEIDKVDLMKGSR